MAPFTAKTSYAATGQTLPAQHRDLFDTVTPDITALAETGQTIPPQRYNPNDASMTDVAVVAENAGCVGRVCSRGSMSQTRSAQSSSDSGQSHSKLLRI